MAPTDACENNVLHLKGDSAEKIQFDFEQSYQQSYDNAIGHFVQALEQCAPFETDGNDNLRLHTLLITIRNTPHHLLGE